MNSPESSEPSDRPDIVRPVYFNAAAAAEAAAPVDDAGPMEEMPADSERRGVGRAQIAALLSVAGIALFLIGPIAVILIAGLSLPFLGTIFGTAALTIGLLELLLGLVVAGAALQLVSFGVYTSSFGLLRWVDPRFRAPRALGAVGLTGFLLVLLAMGTFLGLVYEAVHCALTGVTGCVVGSEIYAVAILSLLGSILAFVGWIGVLLGLYRLGSRYESGLLKAAAILMIFPVANVVAPLLAFVALHQVPRRFDLSAAPPAGEGSA